VGLVGAVVVGLGLGAAERQLQEMHSRAGLKLGLRWLPPHFQSLRSSISLSKVDNHA